MSASPRFPRAGVAARSATQRAKSIKLLRICSKAKPSKHQFIAKIIRERRLVIRMSGPLLAVLEAAGVAEGRAAAGQARKVLVDCAKQRAAEPNGRHRGRGERAAELGPPQYENIFATTVIKRGHVGMIYSRQLDERRLCRRVCHSLPPDRSSG